MFLFASIVSENTNERLSNVYIVNITLFPWSKDTKSYCRRLMSSNKKKIIELKEKKNGSYGKKQKLCYGKNLVLITQNGMCLHPVVMKKNKSLILFCQKMILIFKVYI